MSCRHGQAQSNRSDPRSINHNQHGRGKARKKAVKRVSQEALRAEIVKDARALQHLSSIHPALEKRKVDGPRLAKLVTVAESLSGKLAERAAAKGCAEDRDDGHARRRGAAPAVTGAGVWSDRSRPQEPPRPDHALTKPACRSPGAACPPQPPSYRPSSRSPAR